MKTKENTKSVIEQLRDIRDAVSLDIKDMSFEQLQAYLAENTKIHPSSDWHLKDTDSAK